MSEKFELKTYIRLYRSIEKWGWYTDSNTKSLFLHCLIKANFKDKEFLGNVVVAGSFITSLNHLSLETGLTVQQIRTCIKNLLKTNEIIVKSTNNFTQIFVVKWSDYQCQEDDDNKRITNEQQTDNKRSTTTNNDKKDNKYNNKELCKSVIEYLNLKSQSKFTPSKAHCSHINARSEEGHTLDDFKKVIDNMCDKWLTDKDMSQYLRPSTLFGTKFEGYLSMKPVISKRSEPIPDYDSDYRPKMTIEEQNALKERLRKMK